MSTLQAVSDSYPTNPGSVPIESPGYAHGSAATTGATEGVAVGATTGAAIGSAFPGAGTLIGAGIGAGVGGILGGIGGYYRAESAMNESKKAREWEAGMWKQQFEWEKSTWAQKMALSEKTLGFNMMQGRQQARLSKEKFAFEKVKFTKGQEMEKQKLLIMLAREMGNKYADMMAGNRGLTAQYTNMVNARRGRSVF